MIIGVTGLTGSGKGVVSDILVKNGFVKLGHSEIINEELNKKGITINRDNQVVLANEMRKLNGASYFARKLIDKIDFKKNYVVEGFRNIAEIEEFRKFSNFFFIGVAAGSKRRFEWVLKRNRLGDPKNFEEFMKNEKRDFFQFDKPEGQQNAICFSMADYFITNEGSLEDLKKEVEKIIWRIKNT